MGREAPMNPSPLGKPSIKSLQTPTSKGKFDVISGHGKEYAQASAKTSYSGGGVGGKKLVDIHTGHGTEYSSETSRG